MRTKVELKFASFASFPTSWNNNILYIATDTNKTYRWNGSIYVEIWGSGWSGDVVWPASATDNAIARFDTITWKLIQNSSISIDDNWNLENTNWIKFDITPNALTNNEWIAIWNSTDKCLDIYDWITRLQVWQEMHVMAYNNTWSTILNWKAVYISWASWTRPTIALWKADNSSTSDAILWIATQDIANNSEWKITIAWLVNNLDTTAFSAWDALYLSETTAWWLTKVQPQSPNWLVHLWHVIVVDALLGSIFVDPNVVTQTANSVRITSGVWVTEMNNVQDFFRHSWSTWVTDLCNPTSDWAGWLNITAWEVLIRETNSDDWILTPFVVPSINNLALTNNDVNYIYLTQSAWVVSWNVTTDPTLFDWITKVIVFIVSRDWTQLNIVDLRKINVDWNRKHRRQSFEYDWRVFKWSFWSVQWPSTMSASGLNILVSVWKVFVMDTPIIFWPFDTTIAWASLSNNYFRFTNRSSYAKSAALKTMNNTQYDNAWTLTTMTNNRWRRDDWYVVLCNTNYYLAKIMGNNEATSEAAAIAFWPPATLPSWFDWQWIAMYLWYSTIQKSAASATFYNFTWVAWWIGTWWVTAHTWLTALSWTSSGHIGTINTLATFGTAWEATSITLTAWQSVRLNAWWTALEAYTPAWLTWWSSISSWTGIWITMTTADLWWDKAFLSMAHTASWTLTANTTNQIVHSTNRTHTNASSITDNFNNLILTRTNVMNQAWWTLLSQWAVLSINWSDTQTAWTLTPSYNLLNLNPSLRSTWSSINISQSWSNAVAPTNWHLYMLLGNTQNVAHTMAKIDLWTSAQWHTWLLVNATAASTSAFWLKVDFWSTWTWTWLRINWTSTNNWDMISIVSSTAWTPSFAYFWTPLWSVRLFNSMDVNNQSAVFIDINVLWTAWTLTSRATDQNQISASRTHTGATTITDSWKFLYLRRYSTINNSWWVMNVNWPVLKIEAICTQTAWTLNDTADNLNLTQSSTITTWKLLTWVVWSTERFKAHPMVANSWTNNAYLFDTTTSLSWTTTLWIFANAWTAKWTLDNAWNQVIAWSIKTWNPNTGTATPWKLWNIITGQVWLVLIATQYIELDVNWTLYRLATV